MLKEILSISGYSGLYKLISSAKSTLIVESLTDKKRMPVYSSAKVSALDEIVIFTEEEDAPLSEVLKNIFKKEEGGKAISPKVSGKELKAYFKEILPNYDEDRVYVSDMKKIFSWYNILQENDLLKIEEKNDDVTT